MLLVLAEVITALVFLTLVDEPYFKTRDNEDDFAMETVSITDAENAKGHTCFLDGNMRR